jgi:hypothetical protein
VSDDPQEAPVLCDRCHYDEADPDQPIPTYFRWLVAVCYGCSQRLRVIADSHGDLSGEMDI